MDPAIVNQLISGGLPAGVLTVALLVIWPYLKDTHLPRLAAAKEKQAAAFDRIADSVDRTDVRLTTVEQTQTRILDAVTTTSRDLAVLSSHYAPRRDYGPGRREATPAEVAATVSRP